MSQTHTHHKPKAFSALVFIVIITFSLAVTYGILALVAPNVFWGQFESSWKVHLLTFLGCHLFNGLFEHPFHRYVLHSPLVPGFSSLYKKHTKHHALTRIRMTKRDGVENYYPIIEEKQFENSFFPWWSFFAFAGMLTVPFVLIHRFFPGVPISFEGYLALAWSISLYEILHAFEHKSLDWWIPKIEHSNSLYRYIWRVAYGFHLRHHANPHCNENISGFFGIPVADFLLGTWINPSTMYNHGSKLGEEEFAPPKPIFLIRWLDRFAEYRYIKRRIRLKGVDV